MIKRKKHIVVLPSWYATNNESIKGSFFREQAIAFAKCEYKVSLVYFGFDNEDKEKKFSDNGVNVYLKTGKTTGVFSIPRVWFKTIGMIRQLKNTEKIDIIHVQSFFIGMPALICKLLWGIPYIVTEHSSIFLDGNINLLMKLYAKLVFLFSNKVVCVSNNLKNQLLKYTNKDILVIHNMVDNIFFEVEREANPAYYSTFYSCGNLIKSKGFYELLNCSEKLKEEGLNFTITISGDGVEREKLEKIINERKLDKIIKFTGIVNREEVSKYMANAKAFILLTKYETFGLVFAEATATGTPIIIPDIPVAKELVDCENGIMVNLNKEDTIIEAMRDIIYNRRKFEDKKIRLKCKKTFCTSVFLEKYDNLIKTII